MTDGQNPPPQDPPPEGTGGGQPPPPESSPYGAAAPGGPPPPPPPPPEGGYAAAPPPPPGSTDPNARPYSAPDSIGYGWSSFFANPTPLLLGALIVVAVSLVVGIVASLFASALFGGPLERGLVEGFLYNLVVSLLVGIVGQILYAGLIKGSLAQVDGRPISVGQMWSGLKYADIAVAGILVSVMTSIGTALCVLPGLVVGYLAMFTLYFVVDQGMAPVEAIKASFSFVTSNLGDTLVYYVLVILVVIAGAILCGVGLLAALPIALLAGGYTFRRLHQQPVAPAKA
ncbi:hypothetical protein [Nocardioides aequoreus]|uniref:hypothetical protein n=1 Tax=Nocardioides aequoreus TaxID=397278 RepID=UPI0004C2DEEF|nr:hypothetical protein [Nocardioides aequoreus]